MHELTGVLVSGERSDEQVLRVSDVAAVKGIKKQHLVEVRSLNNPPEVVKVALESICTLLGERDVDWKSMRQIIMRDNFIPSIVNFDTEKMS